MYIEYMKKLRRKTYRDIYNDLMSRIANTPLNLNEYQIKQAILEGVRQLNEQVYFPRAVGFRNTELEIDVTDWNIDDISTVFVSQTAQQVGQILPEVGLLPLLLGAGGLGGTRLDGIADWITMKGTLNMMFRQLGFGVDYELYQLQPTEDYPNGKQVFRTNQPYRFMVIEYLPFIDAEDPLEQWEMWDAEYHFAREYAWAFMNKISAEALMGGMALGVYKEAEQMAKFWDDKCQALIKQFNDQSVIMYMG